jgi:hypothetical protein
MAVLLDQVIGEHGVKNLGKRLVARRREVQRVLEHGKSLRRCSADALGLLRVVDLPNKARILS